MGVMKNPSDMTAEELESLPKREGSVMRYVKDQPMFFTSTDVEFWGLGLDKDGWFRFRLPI